MVGQSRCLYRPAILSNLFQSTTSRASCAAGLANLKVYTPAGRGCTDAALTLLKYRLTQGLVTSMCPYPYTISSVSDMAAVAGALVRLEHSGIIVDEVVSMMMLTLAKVWASPPGGFDGGSLPSSRGRTVEFRGSSLIRLVSTSIFLECVSCCHSTAILFCWDARVLLWKCAMGMLLLLWHMPFSILHEHIPTRPMLCPDVVCML